MRGIDTPEEVLGLARKIFVSSRLDGEFQFKLSKVTNIAQSRQNQHARAKRMGGGEELKKIRK